MFSSLNKYWYINSCREAFSGFDAEVVAKFNEKKITSVSADTGIDISLTRGAVDNAKRILEVLYYKIKLTHRCNLYHMFNRFYISVIVIINSVYQNSFYR